MRLISKANFLAKIDLKDAYFLIPVEEGSSEYLRFEYESQLYEFVVLTFGLS